MNFLDLFFPKKCVLCGKNGQYFCPQCSQKIKSVNQICPVCEQGSYFGQTHHICQSKLNLDGLTSFFLYGETIRAAVHKLKYKYVTDLGNEFYQLVKNQITQKEKELTFFEKFIKEKRPTVIPIPLYWLKENRRGFNQAGLIGKMLSDHYKLPFSSKALIRVKGSPSQTTLHPKERQKNVEGVFSVPANYLLLTTSYLVVDDVWTTGATLRSAGTVLKKSGAKEIWGLTIVR